MSNKTYYEKNKEKFRQYYLLDRERKIKLSRQAKIKRLFGLTPEDCEQLKIAQDYRCAICENPLQPGKRTHIDHCHTTNKVRGILCENCNRGLGLFKDNPQYLRKAIQYLNANQ